MNALSLFAIHLLSIFWLIGAVGCALESNNPAPDSGIQDSGGDGDETRQYPPGPYGTGYMDTVENFQIEKVICQGDNATGRDMRLDDWLGAPAILVSVHAGWCGPCKAQAPTMEPDLQQPYSDNGLEIMLVIYEDENGSSNPQNLRDYACDYKKTYGFTFTMAIDPNAAVLGKYLEGTPMNMLLDDDMRIRYKVDGIIPDSHVLEGNIEGLLNE